MPEQAQDRLAAPIMQALAGYSRRQTVRFHMPGHKGGCGAHPPMLELAGEKAFRCDVTNVPGMDDLHQPRDVIRQAQQLAAAAFGADETYFLVNGASCGLHALVLAACNPGEKVLVPRNLHRSLLGGLILSGAVPVFYQPAYDPEVGLPLAVSPRTVAEKLKEHPDARAVFVVHPTYHGVASPIAEIAEVVHARAIPLLVDEAHGPHLPFHEALPASALAQGADACVQGTHKILSAFTQAAMLHVRGERVDRVRLEAVLRLLQSTSTSYLLLASLDAARLQMTTCGRSLLQGALDQAEGLRQAVNEMEGLFSFDEEWARERGAAGLDRLKVTITVGGLGVSGFRAESWLRERYGVQVEMSDPLNLLVIVNFGNTAADIRCLLRGLREMRGLAGRGNGPRPASRAAGLLPPPPPLAVSPREAFLAPATAVALEEAVGLVSGEIVSCYPPGIPVLCPGEVVTREVVDYLVAARELGARLQGQADPSASMLRVLA